MDFTVLCPTLLCFAPRKIVLHTRPVGVLYLLLCVNCAMDYALSMSKALLSFRWSKVDCIGLL